MLDQIYQSLTNSETQQPIIRGVLEKVAQTDPAGALNFALTIEGDSYNTIVRDLAGIWANSDPRSALTAIAGIENESVRKAMVDTVVRAWAKSEPRKMFESVDALPAASSRVSVQSRTEQLLARESPEEAAGLVAAMESSPLKTSSAASVVSVWSRRDHNAALEWIRNEPGVEEIRSTLLFSIVDKLFEVDPLLAMTSLLSQAIERYASVLGLEGTKEEMELEVISTLAKSNLETAIDFLPSVSGDRTKLAAFKEIAEKLIRNEEFDRAFTLAGQFDYPDGQNFHIALAAAWAESDIGELLISMDLFTSEELKSKVAFMLLDNSRYRGSSSDEQILEARKYLSDEHRKALEEGDSDVLPPVIQDF